MVTSKGGEEVGEKAGTDQKNQNVGRYGGVKTLLVPKIKKKANLEGSREGAKDGPASRIALPKGREKGEIREKNTTKRE